MFKQVLDDAPVGFWVQDDRGRVGYINRRLVELLECADASEIVGRDAESFVSDEDVGRFREHLLQLDTASRDPYPLLLRGHGGRHISTLIYPMPILDASGHPIAAACFVMDAGQIRTCCDAGN